MQLTELVFSLTGLMDSKRAATVFVNGAPGSGKTTLLNQLRQQLPKFSKFTRVFGPYQSNSIQDFTSALMNECYDAGLLEVRIPEEKLWDIIGSFDWLRKNLQTTSRENFVIFVDLEYRSIELDSLRSWFSSIRALEDRWEDAPARLLIVLAGYWNHNLLDAYYRNIRLSFPYTISHNYFHWYGISIAQMVDLVQQYFPGSQEVIPYGALLHEVTGGHPGAAVEIAEIISKKQVLSIPTLFSAVKQVACKGKVTAELIHIWIQLPTETKLLLEQILLGYPIRTNTQRQNWDSLCTAGLTKEVIVARIYYGNVSSWFVECVLRSHLEELGIENPNLSQVFIDELVPPLLSINKEAYQIINEIENLVRNFATLQLSKSRKVGKSLLANRATKYDNFIKEELDAQEQAEEWKKSSRKSGLPVELNPDIAYISIKVLAKLVDEIAKEINSEKWKNIAVALQTTSPIRDAVMHNQLIDDKAYAQLLDLRAAIYKALSPK